MTERPIALRAAEVPPRPRAQPATRPTSRRRSRAREKRVLGDPFGLANFGVNLTRLAPGAALLAPPRACEVRTSGSTCWKARRHWCRRRGVRLLAPGDCAGFAAGGPPHHLVNHGDQDVVILEVGDRTAGDSVIYPEDDLAAAMQPDGSWRYTRKDGTPL